MENHNLQEWLLDQKESVFSWVDKNQHLFFLTDKSCAEYYEEVLFRTRRTECLREKALTYLMRSFDLHDLQNIQYSSLNNSKFNIDYRFLEKNAIYVLYKGKGHNLIDEGRILSNSCFKKLIVHDYPRSVLLDRNFLYSITHFCFYFSYFNEQTSHFRRMVFNEIPKIRVKQILVLGMYISLIKRDIDVLLELLVSSVLLDCMNDLDFHLQQLIILYLEKSYVQAGYINPILGTSGLQSTPNMSINAQLDFKDIYHSSLILKILLNVL
ncbi:hypothetical protein NRF22_06330 [Oenococcus kitaharae]|uniref:hypothetical protein n=1 Tax=Oenococcus TaxID=46254 RepID=UPI0021E9270D|nr:hypothetical protein [Oenococcus kitaharae]MCV3296731.1 hypothetical protein [Oenococcus kitaharae]